MTLTVLIGWMQAQALNLPPFEDVVRWAFYGVAGWMALRTESNGRALAFLKGSVVTEERLTHTIDKLRDDVTAVLTTHQDDTKADLEATHRRMDTLHERVNQVLDTPKVIERRRKPR